MKTTIDNNSRVFQIVTSTNNQVFCNLEDIESTLNKLEARAGYFTIYHFWDNKQKKISKKYLKSMLDAHKLNSDFINFI